MREQEGDFSWEGANGPRVNVEVKVKCVNHDRARAFLQANGAVFAGKERQVDTYFKVERGRLKLREGETRTALIFYQRNDQAGPRRSEWLLFEMERESTLKEILLRSLDQLVTVEKKREVYYLDNLKFNLDTVEGLGAFLEIEALAPGRGFREDELVEQCERCLQEMGIEPEDLVTVSYSDLLAD